MSALGSHSIPPRNQTGEGQESCNQAPARPGYMSQDAAQLEKSALQALAAHQDARALVRLIQCPRCSKPFRTPVTLPCGNSLCRECLPQQTHTRENITYPDLPGRKEALRCPFEQCAREHPKLDCNVDVILSKIMYSIADVVARHASIAGIEATTMEGMQKVELRHDEVVSSQPTTGVPHTWTLPGARLIATYALAAQGELAYQNELVYQDTTQDMNQRSAMDVAVLQELLESTRNQVDCQVCYNIMLDPVTTYCGHTLCRRCLTRVLDHSLHCPVCRRDVTIPPSLHDHPSNKTLVDLLDGLCPELIASRAEAVTSEEQGEGELNVPLFVCTLGFPHMPTFLRIFEPRYRLMLRRCLESNRQFGMLMYNRYGEPQGDLGPVHFYHYGTMLNIVHSQQMPDGTSFIETRGSYRFRVKAHGSLDGYNVGSVERVEDVPLAEEERIEAEETSLPPVAETAEISEQVKRMSTQDMLALGHEFVARMRGRSARWLQQRVLDIHGNPPLDAAVFPYWFASVLPISDEEKYKLLATTTVRERLKITASWIRRIESQRWYQSNACRIL